jgi:glucuronate isomerase
MGVLSQFIGMVTDSRSFLSFPRHEYFRRLLCGILGDDMARGLMPIDIDLAGNMVRDICYYNAKRYFRFPDRATPSGVTAERTR